MSDVKEVVEAPVVEGNVEAKVEASKILGGIKVEASNEEGMKIAENEAKKGELVEEALFPSFFIEPNQVHKLEFDILFNKVSGAILSVSKKGLNVNFKTEFPQYGYSKEWFEFSQPTYEQLSSYRQRCANFNVQARQVIIDAVLLRNFFLAWHLKDWSLKDKQGNKIELKHDEDGSLSAECLKKVMAVFPSLVDVVLTSYEKDIMLTS